MSGDAGWKRLGPGMYRYDDAQVFATVQLRGELWRNKVFYKEEGNRLELVDLGEWDSRWTALTNARRAIRHCIALRSPLAMLAKAEEDEALFGDDE